jgi:hypothetical protein
MVQQNPEGWLKLPSKLARFASETHRFFSFKSKYIAVYVLSRGITTQNRTIIDRFLNGSMVISWKL